MTPLNRLKLSSHSADRSIRPGVLDGCLYLSLALVVLICVGLVWKTWAWTNTNAEHFEMGIVETVAGEILGSFDSLDFSIAKTSKSLQVAEVWELRPELQQNVLFGSWIPTRGLSSIYVIGADGNLKAMAGDQAPPAANFSDRAFFDFHRTHLDPSVHVSDPLVGRLFGEPIIILSKRINDRNGHFAGVITGGVQLSYFQNLFRRLNLKNGRVISLHSMDGRVVAQLPADARTDPDAGKAAIFKQANLAANGVYTGKSSTDGRQLLVAYRQIDGFPFVVTYSQPIDAILTEWVNYSLVAGVALLVFIFFGILAIRELRRERGQRARAEHRAWQSAQSLSTANIDLERRIGKEVQSRKEAQEKLAKSQRLEALGQLAGGIAHDMNNVLQTVTGACALVQAQQAENEDIRRLIAIAMSAADRGSSVTQRLLLFARRADIKPESVNTAAVLDDLHELLSHTLCNNAMLRLDLPQEVPDLIADRMQLETVIINLVTNARDAMPEGGTITIGVQAKVVDKDDVQVLGLSPGRYVRLRVEDTGIGMDEHILARAAEPFFSTKGVGEGTGLGLSMAKGFAEQSKGKFELVSNVGEGTTVSLWFPAATTTHAQASVPAQTIMGAERSGSRIRVLMVDDNVEASELVGEWLVAFEFEVHRAICGRDALEIIKAGLKIDLLLTDLSMPEMNGLQLIREVRSIFPGLPAILLTGNTSAVAALTLDDAAGEKCIALQKPVRLPELVNHIEDLVRDVNVPFATAQAEASSHERIAS